MNHRVGSLGLIYPSLMVNVIDGGNMKMVSAKVFLVLSLICPVAMAQVVSFGELQKKGAVKLSAQELRGIADGARVDFKHENGRFLVWKNEKGGKLTASSAPRAGAPSDERVRYGRGTWRIEDDGRYCVEIARPGGPQTWCHYIFQSGKTLYSSSETANPDGKAYLIKFRK